MAHFIMAAIMAAILSLSGWIPDVKAGYDENLDFGYKVVCYYNVSGAWFRRHRAMYLPKNIDTHLCTHINYYHAIIDPDTLTIAPSNSWVDIDNELYARVTPLKYENPTLNIMLTVTTTDEAPSEPGAWFGVGGHVPTSRKFTRILEDSSARRLFVQSVVIFLKYHKFDGLDLIWGGPECHGDSSDSDTDKEREVGDGPCSPEATRSIRAKFTELVAELRRAFDRSIDMRPLQLSLLIPSDPVLLERGFDIPALSRYADFFNIMSFDYHLHHGHRNQEGKNHVTLHHAAFFPPSNNPRSMDNANFTLNYLLKLGANKRKLVLGVPSFGRSWTLKDKRQTGIGAPIVGPGRSGELTKETGLLSQYEICDRVLNMAWVKRKDPDEGSYAFDSGKFSGHPDERQWVSYDDPEQTDIKGRFLRTNKFGGMMIWTLDLDDFMGSCYGVKSPITRAAHIALLH